MIHRAPDPDSPVAPSAESAPLPDMILEAGLPPNELVRRLVVANRGTGMGNRALAFYLHDMQTRGEHHALSFASAAHFAMARLEMGKTAAFELLSLGATLDGLPRIDAAFCEGEISWSKVKLLCRVAVPDTEVAWLEVGRELTCRQLEREVSAVEGGTSSRPTTSTSEATAGEPSRASFAASAPTATRWCTRESSSSPATRGPGSPSRTGTGFRTSARSGRAAARCTW